MDGTGRHHRYRAIASEGRQVGEGLGPLLLVRQIQMGQLAGPRLSGSGLLAVVMRIPETRLLTGRERPWQRLGRLLVHHSPCRQQRAV